MIDLALNPANYFPAGVTNAVLTFKPVRSFISRGAEVFEWQTLDANSGASGLQHSLSVSVKRTPTPKGIQRTVSMSLHFVKAKVAAAPAATGFTPAPELDFKIAYFSKYVVPPGATTTNNKDLLGLGVGTAYLLETAVTQGAYLG